MGGFMNPVVYTQRIYRGSKRIVSESLTPSALSLSNKHMKEDCKICEGKGFVTDILKTCRVCDGSGFEIVDKPKEDCGHNAIESNMCEPYCRVCKKLSTNTSKDTTPWEDEFIKLAEKCFMQSPMNDYFKERGKSFISKALAHERKLAQEEILNELLKVLPEYESTSARVKNFIKSKGITLLNKG